MLKVSVGRDAGIILNIVSDDLLVASFVDAVSVTKSGVLQKSLSQFTESHTPLLTSILSRYGSRQLFEASTHPGGPV